MELVQFYNFLKNKYDNNNPIFVRDIKIGELSYAQICQYIKRLCDAGKIKRYEKGIYYFPTQTILGVSELDFMKVLEQKYIRSGSAVYGYFSGLTLINKLALSTQVPNIFEIVTNNESSKRRQVVLGNRKIVVKKSRVKITNRNVKILQFLELLNTLDIKLLGNLEIEILKTYVRDNKIKQKDVIDYVGAYPNRVSKLLVESRLINEFA